MFRPIHGHHQVDCLKLPLCKKFHYGTKIGETRQTDEGQGRFEGRKFSCNVRWPGCSQRIIFFLNNQSDALIIKIYSVIKLYMFRASSLPIIRSSLYSPLVSSMQALTIVSKQCQEFQLTLLAVRCLGLAFKTKRIDKKSLFREDRLQGSPDSFPLLASSQAHNRIFRLMLVLLYIYI